MKTVNIKLTLAENVKNFLEGNYEKCIRNVVNGVKLQ